MSDPASGMDENGEATAASTPLVSVCLPTYNGEKTLRRALRSLVEQGYPNIEILIGDDASGDGTAGIGMAAAPAGLLLTNAIGIVGVAYTPMRKMVRDENLPVGPNP